MERKDGFVDQWFNAIGVKKNYKTMQYYAGDGNAARTFEINFDGGYIARSDIKAFAVKDDSRERVDYTLTFIGPNSIKLNAAVPVGWTVLLYRDTPKARPLAKFVDGAVISAYNLDRNAQQAVFAVAEMVDRFDSVVYDVEAALEQVYTANVNAKESLRVSAGALDQAQIAVRKSDAATATANSANTKADAAVKTANEAKTIASGIDAKATSALAKATTAETNAAKALTTANGVDAKASTALTQSTAAVKTANEAKVKADAVDGKATEALSTANAASAKVNTALPLTGGTVRGQVNLTNSNRGESALFMPSSQDGSPGNTFFNNYVDGKGYYHSLYGNGNFVVSTRLGTEIQRGGLKLTSNRPDLPVGPGGYQTSLELGSGGIGNPNARNGMGFNPDGNIYLWNTASGDSPTYSMTITPSGVNMKRTVYADLGVVTRDLAITADTHINYGTTGAQIASDGNIRGTRWATLAGTSGPVWLGDALDVQRRELVSARDRANDTYTKAQGDERYRYKQSPGWTQVHSGQVNPGVTVTMSQDVRGRSLYIRTTQGNIANLYQSIPIAADARYYLTVYGGWSYFEIGGGGRTFKMLEHSGPLPIQLMVDTN